MFRGMAHISATQHTQSTSGQIVVSDRDRTNRETDKP